MDDDVKRLKWTAYDKLHTSHYHQKHKHWAALDIAAWCVLETEGGLENFQNLKAKYALKINNVYSQKTTIGMKSGQTPPGP